MNNNKDNKETFKHKKLIEYVLKIEDKKERKILMSNLGMDKGHLINHLKKKEKLLDNKIEKLESDRKNIKCIIRSLENGGDF